MINLSKQQKPKCWRNANISFITICTQINHILNTCTLINFLRSQKSSTELFQLLEQLEYWFLINGFLINKKMCNHITG